MRALRAALFTVAMACAVPAEARTIADAPVPRHAKGDPLEGFNRAMFGVSMALDRAIFRPLAIGTTAVIPKPVRRGLRNLLRNLTEPIVFLNDVLQLKPKRALRTVARFALNSTVGVAGLFDVAVKAKIRYRANGFGTTLARYGVGPGPYLFLPLIGPGTLRDVAGTPVDGLVLPIVIGKPFDRLWWQVGTGLYQAIDARAEADDQLKALYSGAADPYATLRSVYTQNRAAEINENKGLSAEPAKFDDPLDDPAAAAPGSALPESLTSPGAAEPDPADAPTAEDVSPPARIALMPPSDCRY